jgi:hypothetical protein
MRGLFEVTGRVHAVTRIAQAAQHHRLQHGIVFDEQNSHSVTWKEWGDRVELRGQELVRQHQR